jgi:hypothetical protein
MREVNVNMICWLIFCVIFMILNSDLYFTESISYHPPMQICFYISVESLQNRVEYNSSDCLIESFWNFTCFLITI